MIKTPEDRPQVNDNLPAEAAGFRRLNRIGLNRIFNRNFIRDMDEMEWNVSISSTGWTELQKEGPTINFTADSMEYSAQWTLSVIELLDLLLVNIFILIRDSHQNMVTICVIPFSPSETWTLVLDHSNFNLPQILSLFNFICSFENKKNESVENVFIF